MGSDPDMRLLCKYFKPNRPCGLFWYDEMSKRFIIQRIQILAMSNFEFPDLFDGGIDKGYPQHKKLREWIEKEYRADNDLDRLVKEMRISK